MMFLRPKEKVKKKDAKKRILDKVLIKKDLDLIIRYITNGICTKNKAVVMFLLLKILIRNTLSSKV